MPLLGWCMGRGERDAPGWHPASCKGHLTLHGEPQSWLSIRHALRGVAEGQGCWWS